MIQFLISALVLFSALINVSAAPAEDPVEVRFLAERLPNKLGKVVIASEETRSDPFNLPMNNLSAPLKVPARIFSLLESNSNTSLAKIKLPKVGKSFVVILIPSAYGVYEPLVLPFENQNFKGGDIYFHNNTNKMVIGLIGKTKLLLSPNSGKAVTPRVKGKKKFFHVMLGIREAKGDRVIKSMKWPVSKRMRNYVFFYVDPKKKRVVYRAVDEFILPKKEPEEL